MFVQTTKWLNSTSSIGLEIILAGGTHHNKSSNSSMHFSLYHAIRRCKLISKYVRLRHFQKEYVSFSWILWTDGANTVSHSEVLLGPLSWCPFLQTSHCDSLNDRSPVDFIYDMRTRSSHELRGLDYAPSKISHEETSTIKQILKLLVPFIWWCSTSTTL